LIANVLDFSRLERGEKRFRREPVDLCGLAREVTGSFEPQFARDELSAHLDLPAHPVVVEGDPDALAQIANNLLSNAAKYAATGREVRVRVANSGAEAILEVQDRGPGVPRG